MTDRDPIPELPKCPECRSRQNVTVLDEPPKHDPRAIYGCLPCNLSFVGSQAELFEYAAKKARVEAERGIIHQSAEAGRAAGVIGSES